jgi:hypothetical protein
MKIYDDYVLKTITPDYGKYNIDTRKIEGREGRVG